MNVVNAASNSGDLVIENNPAPPGPPAPPPGAPGPWNTTPWMGGGFWTTTPIEPTSPLPPTDHPSSFQRPQESLQSGVDTRWMVGKNCTSD